MRPFKVLVPIDLSPSSLQILDFALSRERLGGAEFTLLYVVPSGEVETFASLGGGPEEGFSKIRKEALVRLEKEARNRSGGEGAPDIVCRVSAGVPFREICRLAEDESFDLIVLGTHGRTGLPHLLLGSNAERVVQHASCPVLSVTPRVLRGED
ncbi:MAG: universal stress protein [Desulfuromonas sp.]|uniref:universal stress protein n=1 Tax=Desulfuromonas sp. TaxID=892 RepID=UPI000CC7778C|nr:universal stress protein [Desulfuromonas sp.]PLX85110.1 MAG: universal stress protein [Desulfuromonas sp.]